MPTVHLGMDFLHSTAAQPFFLSFYRENLGENIGSSEGWNLFPVA